MKKNYYYRNPRNWLQKGCRIMRITIFLCLISVIQVFAIPSLGQVKLNLKMKNTTIEKVLQEIEEGTNFRFFYQSDDLQNKQHIDIEFEQKSVRDILDEVLPPLQLRYEVFDNYIAIKTEVAGLNTQESVQQQKSVSGKVTDSSGSPLPGVTVVIKGTTQGTVTDIDGNYSISNIPEDATLIFSFVGMKTQEISAAGKSSINVTMAVDAIGIEEVVAIGYGTMKKSDLTGSVASVKSDKLSAFPTTNITQALQGRTAGVQILQNTGAPGATMQVRIRGANSIKGSNGPLWIIDGFPGDQKILNPSDIESIEVLKDASATAIYGSRGANGVILVTTKRGKAGATRVEYEGSFSLQTLRKKLDLMNAKEYMQFYNIEQINDAGEEYFTNEEIKNAGKGTDWQDLIFRTAPVQNHSLNVTGGNEKTQFSVGASYLDQAGIIENNDYRRIVLRSNVTHDISKKFAISYNVILSRTEDNSKNSGGGNRGGSLISATISAPPTVDPYDDDGEYRMLTDVYPFSSNNIWNPVAYVNEVSSMSVSNKVMANLAFIYKPINGLSIKISGNVSNTDGRGDGYTTTKYPNSSGSASISSNNSLHINSDNIITYNKTINDDHHISATGAFTYENDVYKSFGASGTGFLSDVYETYNLGSANELNTPYSGYSEWALLSYLGRLNYSYKNKYLATISFRTDGSSRYSEGNKWGNFKSGALAWRISEEEFMKDISIISDAKIRLGYGETGSTAISPYYTLDMLSSGKTVFDDALYTYFAPGTRLTGDLKWETTAQTDIGLDVGIFNNRVRLTADYYIKNTRDLLNTVQLPASLGFTTTVKNIGEISNKGLELQVDASISDRQFKWDVGANISSNRNKVIKLYEGQDIMGANVNMSVVHDYPILLTEGKPLSMFYGYQESGYDENGYLTYKDNDGEEGITEEDKTFIGDPNPDFIYGFNSNMSWKNFEFSFFIQGSYGNDIFGFSMINQTLDYGYGLNTFKELLYNHWTPETPNAKYPIISRKTTTRMSDRFIYDGSYLRLKNIQLAYNFSVNRFGIHWFKKAQIYISGQNLLTFTSYPWWDPEVNSWGGDSSVNQGLDIYTYPTAKGFTAGLKLSF